MEAQTQYPPAGVWRRVAAMFYDCFLLFAVLFIATALAGFLVNQGAELPSVADGETVNDIPQQVSGWGFQLYLFLVTALFYSIFWRKNGQTLGMQAWRIQLQTIDGSTPGWGDCFKRVIAAVIALLPAGLGLWWAWLDADKRSWHDRLSGTRVVLLPKQSRSA